MFSCVAGDLEAHMSLVLSLSHYNDYGNDQASEIAMQNFSMFCLAPEFILRRHELYVACQVPLSMGFPSKNTGVRCHFLLQEIFSTQRLNPGLQHCRWTLYCLSHEGSPEYIHT